MRGALAWVFAGILPLSLACGAMDWVEMVIDMRSTYGTGQMARELRSELGTLTWLESVTLYDDHVSAQVLDITSPYDKTSWTYRDGALLQGRTTAARSDREVYLRTRFSRTTLSEVTTDECLAAALPSFGAEPELSHVIIKRSPFYDDKLVLLAYGEGTAGEGYVIVDADGCAVLGEKLE